MSLSASSEASELARHFGLSEQSALPAVVWVRREAALGFEVARPSTNEELVDWVYKKLEAKLRITNNDHRPGTVWWMDGPGGYAKDMGVVEGNGGVFEHSSFVSHRWYVWPKGTEGNSLSDGAKLGEIAVDQIGELHELTLAPRCVDTNGHCGQWRDKLECERNAGFMDGACPRACGGCAKWEWLYALRLGALHPLLACWARVPSPVDCSTLELPGLERPGPSGAKQLRSGHELASLPAPTLDWLRRAADQLHCRAALDELLRVMLGERAESAGRGRSWSAPPPVPPPRVSPQTLKAPPPAKPKARKQEL